MTKSEGVAANNHPNWLQGFFVARDRYAYAIYLRKDLGLKLVVGFSLGIALYLLSRGLDLPRSLGESPGWRVNFPIMFLTLGLTPLTALLGFIRPFFGFLSFFLSLEIMVLVFVPEILFPLTALAFATLFVWFLVRPERGAMAALLFIPSLAPDLGVGGLAPLGFACFYRFGRAACLTLTCYAWRFAAGLWEGHIPRFGVEDAPLYPKELWLNLTQLNTPPWSSEILAANRLIFARLMELLLGSKDFLQPFLIQAFLALVVLRIVRTQHPSFRYKDRLALEYLSKEGVKIEAPSDWEMFKQPFGVLIGLVFWVGSQTILSFFIPDFYAGELILSDMLSACIVVILVILHYEGDPNMPLEYARDPQTPPIKEPSSLSTGSAFRIPTPSEMRLQYPTPPSPASSKSRDPSHMRLKTWRDKVDLEWEGTLPDGSKVRVGRDKAKATHPPASPTGDSFTVGGMIDSQYKIEQILMGGMGVVYIVADNFSGVSYAVKTLRDDLRTHEEAVARFTSESKTWIRLGHHPHIVQAMFYRVVQDRPLLFLEYVDGTDLEEVFGRPGPRPPLGKFVEWGIQFCAGMEYASQKDLGDGQIGLVHRDIKPGNLMLTKESRIKITDFGLAKVADAPTSLTREKVGLGTLKYMAPEQVKDAKHVDHRADIYSFGAVLYEGIVGHPPFTDEDSVSLYMSVLSKDPPRLKNLVQYIPDEMDRIVMRCLQKDRDQRYSTFEELGWALQRFKDRMTGGGGSPHLQVVS